MKFKLLIIILLAFSTNIFAQKYLSYSDMNYRDDVQTVLLHPTDYEYDKPVIYLKLTFNWMFCVLVCQTWQHFQDHAGRQN